MKKRQEVGQTSHEQDAFIAILAPRFPHIATRLTLIWGSPECEQYINSLFMSRNGDETAKVNGRFLRRRAGFPGFAIRALRVLRELHPHFPTVAADAAAWELNGKVMR
jgi:hypothetical protein